MRPGTGFDAGTISVSIALGVARDLRGGERLLTSRLTATDPPYMPIAIVRELRVGIGTQ